MAIKTIKPVSQTPVTPTPTSLSPTINRGGVTTTSTPTQRTSGLPELIKEQPLPVPNTDQYNQMMAAYQQALGQLGTYGTQMGALQNQINQMTLQAANNPYQKQLMALYQGDPYADLRAQYMKALQDSQQRMNQMFYTGDFSDYG